MYNIINPVFLGYNIIYIIKIRQIVQDVLIRGRSCKSELSLQCIIKRTQSLIVK